MDTCENHSRLEFVHEYIFNNSIRTFAYFIGKRKSSCKSCA